MESLAHKFDQAESQQERQDLVAYALLHTDLDEFVKKHQEGWVGKEGEFARVLARVIQTI